MRYLGIHPDFNEERALSAPRNGREQAHAWLAQFATLLTNPASLGLEDARQRVDLLRFLRDESGQTLAALQAHGSPEDAELQATLCEAIGQIDVVEAELKSHLARLAPGDPSGMVDLAALRGRMASFAARHELRTSPAPVSHLKIRIPPMQQSHRGAGLSILATASVAWWLALIALLLSIDAFPPLAAVSGLTWGALWLPGLKWLGGRVLADEEVILYGVNMIFIRRFMLWKWQEEYRLAPDSRARVEDAGVVIEDQDGTPITMARGRYHKGRLILLNKINSYLNEL